MERFFKSRTLICLLLAAFSLAMFLNALPAAGSSETESGAPGANSQPRAGSSKSSGGAGSEEGTAIAPPSEESSPGMVEKEGGATALKKKKKFPWLLVAGALVAGGIIYFVAVANKKCTLTTTIGAGVSGTPAAGTVKYKKGTVVSYSYAASGGYTNLVVTLDGEPVAASGTVKMDKSHALSATAIESVVLTVTKKAGVNGSPESGTYTYGKGTAVNYSYTRASGYTGLRVKLDGAAVPASGTVTMDANHALTAEVDDAFTLRVTRYDGVNGGMATGSYLYKKGTEVSYTYSLASGYKLLKVQVDNKAAGASGKIVMNSDHTLESWTWKELWIHMTSNNQAYADKSDNCEMTINETSTGGVVFSNIPLPKGAPIVSCEIAYYGCDSGFNPSFRIKGFAEDNSAVFAADGSNKPSTRPLTTAAAEYEDKTLIYCYHDYEWAFSADLSDIVYEIFSRPGWHTGNNLGFVFSCLNCQSNEEAVLCSYECFKCQDPISMFLTYSTRIPANPQDRVCRER